MKKGLLLLLSIFAIQTVSAKHHDVESDETYAVVKDTMYAEDNSGVAKTTLQPALRDNKEIAASIQTDMKAFASIMDQEQAAQDAIERTRELKADHPAKKAAISYRDAVKAYRKAAETSFRRLADAVQNVNNLAHNVAEKVKKDLEDLLEKNDAFVRALDQVRNPKD